MGEQIRVPEGWKVEIRARKTGRKDRYYIEPATGYIFRSLKDIDRYLLTGELGRHVTKSKSKELGSNCVEKDVNQPSTIAVEDQEKNVTGCSRSGTELKQIVSKETKNLKPSETIEESCQAAQVSNGKVSKKRNTSSLNSLETAKNKSGRSSNRTISRSSMKKDTSPFFILDSDQCEEGNAIDIPNLTEIIDAMQKQKEGRDTVYLPAAAVGALFGSQLSETMVKPEVCKNPQFTLTLHKECMKPGLPTMAIKVKLEDSWESKNNMTLSKDQIHHPENKNKTIDVKSEKHEHSKSLFFDDLLTDPCIDFAIKTLTGNDPVGSEPKVENSSLKQQAPGSSSCSMIPREDNVTIVNTDLYTNSDPII